MEHVTRSSDLATRFSAQLTDRSNRFSDAPHSRPSFLTPSSANARMDKLTGPHSDLLRAASLTQRRLGPTRAVWTNPNRARRQPARQQPARPQPERPQPKQERPQQRARASPPRDAVLERPSEAPGKASLAYRWATKEETAYHRFREDQEVEGVEQENAESSQNGAEAGLEGGDARGLIKGGLAFMEQFTIRWYEVGGTQGTASIQTIANLLQESTTSHAAAVGFAHDGLATTPMMRELRLLWIVTRMHIEMEEYPKWGDVVEVETYIQFESSLKTRRDWTIVLKSEGEKRVIGRATSCWVLMHADERRLVRIPQCVREEMTLFVPGDGRNNGVEFHTFSVPKVSTIEEAAAAAVPAPPSDLPLPTSTLSKPNLSVRRSDLDMNEHVNNVTYITWMLEALPKALLESAQLCEITLEYRRECKRGDSVDSVAQFSQAQIVAEATCCKEMRDYSHQSSPCGGLDASRSIEVSTSRESGSGSEPSAASERLRSSGKLGFVHSLRLQSPERSDAEWQEANCGRTVWKIL